MYIQEAIPEKDLNKTGSLDGNDMDPTLYDSIEAPKEIADEDIILLNENRRLAGALRELGNNEQNNRSQHRSPQLESSVEKWDYSLCYKLGYYIPVVQSVLQHNGLVKTGATNRANLIWNPKMKDMEQFAKLSPFQKVNHFPNSLQLGRKDCLNKNIFHMQSKFPKEFAFLPRSYILPQEEPVLIDVIISHKALSKKKISFNLLHIKTKSKFSRKRNFCDC